MNRLMVNYDLLRESAESFRNRNVFYGLSTCEKLPIHLYNYIGKTIRTCFLCSHFSLRSSHFYSRKSVPKGNYAGVTGCSCAVDWAEWWGQASALPSAGFSSPCSPAGALLGSVFSSATLVGFLS